MCKSLDFYRLIEYNMDKEKRKMKGSKAASGEIFVLFKIIKK